MSQTKKLVRPSPFDQLVWFVSVAYPLTAVPQILKVFARHSAADLSIYSWVLYFLLEGILLIYAIRKRLTPIIIQDAMWLVVYGLLIVGIVLYG